MAGLRSVGLISVLMLLLLLFGCGGAPRTEKLSYDRSDANEKLSYDRSDATVKNNVLLDGDNVGGMRISELSGMLEKYSAETYAAPVDATVNSKSWAITPGKPGRQLNHEKILDALKNAGEGDRVDYIFETVQPAISSDVLKPKIRVIGKYTTTLLDRSDKRVNNILLASEKINNTILNPGQEFSFNSIVGKRTAAKGYEEAPIIVRSPEGPKMKKANGGGVCQISTTIYNVVENCGLKVTERHIHSKDVGYVPRGDDATVSYGTVDFRFVNTRKNPIMLKVYLDGKLLKVRILENTAGI